MNTIELDSFGSHTAPNHGAETAIADWKGIGPVLGGLFERDLESA